MRSLKNQHIQTPLLYTVPRMFFGEAIQPRAPFKVSKSKPLGVVLSLTNVALDPSSYEGHLYIEQGRKTILITELSRGDGMKSASINVLLNVNEKLRIIAEKGILHVAGFFENGNQAAIQGKLEREKKGCPVRGEELSIPDGQAIEPNFFLQSDSHEDDELVPHEFDIEIRKDSVKAPKQNQKKSLSQSTNANSVPPIGRNLPARIIKPPKDFKSIIGRNSQEMDLEDTPKWFKGISLEENEDSDIEENLLGDEFGSDSDDDEDQCQDDDSFGSSSEEIERLDSDSDQKQKPKNMEKGSDEEKKEQFNDLLSSSTEKGLPRSEEHREKIHFSHRKKVKTNEELPGLNPNPSLTEEFKIPSIKPSLKK